mgnify:CR=1 FL=1
MVKKQCPACGREIALAKKVCSCGHVLRSNKVRQTLQSSPELPPNERKCYRRRKVCPACGISWPNRTIACTCGHYFRAMPKKRKYGTRGCQKCSKCGLARKGHKCKAVRTREAGPARVTAPKDFGLDDGTPAVNLRAETSTGSRTHGEPNDCAMCDVWLAIKQLRRLVETGSYQEIETCMDAMLSAAKEEMIRVNATIDSVVKLARDKITKMRKSTNVFSLMLASAKQTKSKTKSGENASATSPSNSVVRSRIIKAGWEKKKKRSNDEFLSRLRDGTASLQPIKVDAHGKDIRPRIMKNRITAWRRLDLAKHSILEASKGDADGLVWLIRALYATDGLRQAIDVALLENLRTVSYCFST